MPRVGPIADVAVRDPLGLPRAPEHRPARPGRRFGPASEPSAHELARARLFSTLADEREQLERLDPPRRPFASFPLADRERERHRAGAARLERLLPRPLRALARRASRRLRLPAQATFLAGVAYLLLFNFSVVRGSSMAPGIQDGDRILIDQISYLFREVHRGDIVVLRYPLDPTVDYIKRVIGVPGDEVTIRGGEVFVNGRHLDEPYVLDPDRHAYLTTIVREDHYFVLGDNRPHSSDSREFGQVPAAYLRGKVDLRVWPFLRAGLIH